MRRVFMLFLIIAILAGCHAPEPDAPIQGTESISDTGNLWYIQNESVEAAQVRQMLLTPTGILLCTRDALTLLDSESLTPLARYDLDGTELAYVQNLEQGIAISDPGTKCVAFLDHNLQPVDSVPFESDSNTWLLSPDGTRIYLLSNNGICVAPLSGGESCELLRCRTLSVVGLTDEQIWVAATEAEGIVLRWYVLDLNRSELTELDGSQEIALQEGLRPQASKDYIHIQQQSLTQYASDGTFVSQCTLPEEFGVPGREFLWSDIHNGWFFLGYGAEGSRLLFWDNSLPSEGSSMDLVPEIVPEGSILPDVLYERAEDMSLRFDLDIRIGDTALRNYTAYDSVMLTDPELTAHALDVLEAALEEYPQGFFSQLKHGNRHSVRIELVDSLSGKDGYDVSSGTSAFTIRRDQYCMIVLNAQRIRESAIFHEFSHVIDARLEFESRYRSDALFSEDAWLALQPEGFQYAESYQSIPAEVKKYYDSGYFARNYACVSATEDRAVTMEEAMIYNSEVFVNHPPLMEKLSYYCACIRDSFDTTGWPEVTRWEQVLSEFCAGVGEP